MNVIKQPQTPFCAVCGDGWRVDSIGVQLRLIRGGATMVICAECAQEAASAVNVYRSMVGFIPRGGNHDDG